MEGFLVICWESGKTRYVPWGSHGAPMTGELTAFNFSVWMIATQLPHVTSAERARAFTAFDAAGLRSHMAAALRLLLGNVGL